MRKGPYGIYRPVYKNLKKRFQVRRSNVVTDPLRSVSKRVQCKKKSADESSVKTAE